jgi:hypothetical protein
MTTRNFRVKNGLSVGDITISASAGTITGLSTAAPSADGDTANKKYVDDSINAISTTSITTDSNATNATVSGTGASGTLTITANSNTEVTVTDSGMQLGGSGARVNSILDQDDLSGNSDTALATQQSIKAYVDTEIGNISSTTLTAGNTTAVVSDTGSDGAFTVTADGNTELVVNDTSATFSGNVIVSGNLTVNGTTTTVATTNTTVSDSLIEYGTGTTGTPSNDAGIVIERGDSNNAFIGFDESEDKFKVGTGTFTGASTGNLTITTGTLIANLEGTATAAQYSDVAERFASDTAYGPGTVVALGGAEEITQVNEEASDEVFGVVSSLDQAAFKMNGGAGTDETHPYIAMTGRVDVKVIGTVNKGDRLISASVPGYARAATKAECTAFNVIGRALTSKSEAGQGSVLAAVRVSH